MAVYTELGLDEVQDFFRSYGLGLVQRLEPIAEGIENSNYLVWAGDGEGGRYVLTVFEQEPPERVRPVLELTAALAGCGIPCAAPLKGPRGWLGSLRGKPASVAPFVEGQVIWDPSPAHLESLGRAVAALHVAGRGLPFDRTGAHLADVLCPLALGLAQRLTRSDGDLAELLASEAEHQRTVPEAELPGGLIHADLFRDNVIFGREGPAVRALLDFHLAGRGPWIYDLAVILCDAGWEANGISGGKARALLGAYRALRPMEPREFEVMPDYLRRAALRFLCLRLERFLLRGSDRPMLSGRPKDPAEYATRLRTLRHPHG